jgi:hypothetical protein
MSDRDLEPLGADLARLFDAERDRPAAPSGAQNRVLDRLHATLALGPSLGGGESAGPSGGEIAGPVGSPGDGALAGGGGALAGGSAVLAGGTAAPAAVQGIGAAASTGLLGSLISTIIAKPVVFGAAVFALGGAVGAGVYSSLDAAPPPQAAVIAAPSPAAVEPPRSPAKGAGTSSAIAAPLADTIPSADPAAPPPPIASVRTAPQDTAQPVGRDVDLAAERAVLEEARTAVAGGQSAAAFAALQRHARTFPRGRLVEEREGLWIQTLIASGRQAEARDRVARFRKSFPRSMLLPGFDAALDPIP